MCPPASLVAEGFQVHLFDKHLAHQVCSINVDARRQQTLNVAVQLIGEVGNIVNMRQLVALVREIALIGDSGRGTDGFLRQIIEFVKRLFRSSPDRADEPGDGDAERFAPIRPAGTLTAGPPDEPGRSAL